jgi:hypothetical protein
MKRGEPTIALIAVLGAVVLAVAVLLLAAAGQL